MFELEEWKNSELKTAFFEESERGKMRGDHQYYKKLVQIIMEDCGYSVYRCKTAPTGTGYFLKRKGIK